MCGRYSPLAEEEIIEVRTIFEGIPLMIERDEIGSRAEILREVAPTNRVPIITSDNGILAFEYGKFGFAKWDGMGVIINARGETVTEKPMFKSHAYARRCVIPTSGYFEWKAVAGRRKIKHIIKDTHRKLLFMAGLYREGKIGREFVIITKDPVESIAAIHDRMPVILQVDQLEEWLSGEMPAEVLTATDYDCIGEPFEARNATSAKEKRQAQLDLFSGYE